MYKTQIIKTHLTINKPTKESQLSKMELWDICGI